MEGILMEPEELKKIAAKDKVPLGIVEKDYILTLALGVISILPYSHKEMLFKGGTAIKKVYYPDARFSADLDFTCYTDKTSALHSDLKVIFEKQKDRFGIDFLDVVIEEQRESGARLKVKYNDMNKHPNSFYIDLKIGERPYQKADLIEIQDRYKIRKKLFCGYAETVEKNSYACSHLERCVSGEECLRCDRFVPLKNEGVAPPIRIRTMSIEEILTEKIRAAIARARPRDIYDVWYLTKEKNIKPNMELVNKKLQMLDRHKEFNPDEFKRIISEIEPGWERDLKELLPEVPPFKKIQEDVIAALPSS